MRAGGGSWSAFLEARAADQAAAHAAVIALRDGVTGPALSMLDAWRFAGLPAASALLTALVEAPLAPTADALARQLSPAQHLPRAPTQAAWLHREWLAQKLPSTTPSSPPTSDTGARLAWALLELRALGQDLDHRLRRPWLSRAPTAQAEDAEVSALWTRVASDPWGDRARWEALFLPVVLRAFHGVFEAVNLGRAERRSRLADAEESFFFRLVGRGPEAGWRVLGARVLETGPGGPFSALAATLDPPAWTLAARCAVRRGHGWQTASALWPEAGRARVLAERVGGLISEDGTRLEALAELHAALRLVHRWSQPEQTAHGAAWRVLTQNLGRARGRLRAMVRGLPGDALVRRLSGADALYQRTSAALARSCRGWAFDELRLAFPNDEGRPMEAGCDLQRPELPALDGAVRAWILLVILRGRLEHLRRWVALGTTGDRDAGWGRLLSLQPPPSRRSSLGRAAELDTLRAQLQHGLNPALEQLRPTLAAISAMAGPALELAELHRLLSPVWHPELPLPAAARGALRANAAEALRALDQREARP